MIVNVFAALAYLAVAAAALFLVVGVVGFRRALRAKNAAAHVKDVWEAAFLAGGPGRVTDTALYALYSDGRLQIGDPGVVTITRRTVRNPVDGAIFEAAARSPHGGLGWLRGEVMRSPVVQGIGDGLAERGLMVQPSLIRHWQQWARGLASVCASSGAFVFILYAIEAVEGPTATLFTKVLPPLVAGVVIGVVCTQVVGGRVTGPGRKALATYTRVTGSTRERTVDAAMSRIVAKGVNGMSEPLRTYLWDAARTGPTASRAVSGVGVGVVAVPEAAEAVWCGSAHGQPVRSDGSSGSGGGSGGGGGCGTASCGTSAGDGGGGSGSCGGGGGGGGCGGGGCGGGGGGGG
ncbi:TIGR04222 domain-containing membrane protein [Streptomyces zagrosensis]|uniref:Uncharacterized protein (TIGR04222 family) n=1 Tax=Streptomyces zagrosensis TaxID=1042984 RepID=A0A7W9Q9E3_9ACTN|nr:TIGR04222 domain-containing membrane protein [Streptomyces zagrosensis]MBB5936071.1 uncharacterized protein (TIGR04222 family) [Streptomyces zagrosensis]